MEYSFRTHSNYILSGEGLVKCKALVNISHIVFWSRRSLLPVIWLNKEISCDANTYNLDLVSWSVASFLEFFKHPETQYNGNNRVENYTISVSKPSIFYHYSDKYFKSFLFLKSSKTSYECLVFCSYILGKDSIFSYKRELWREWVDLFFQAWIRSQK